MKIKDKMNTLKDEPENKNLKFTELTEDEVDKVSGGADISDHNSDWTEQKNTL